jgi:hypothetical protein
MTSNLPRLFTALIANLNDAAKLCDACEQVGYVTYPASFNATDQNILSKTTLVDLAVDALRTFSCTISAMPAALRTTSSKLKQSCLLLIDAQSLDLRQAVSQCIALLPQCAGNSAAVATAWEESILCYCSTIHALLGMTQGGSKDQGRGVSYISNVPPLVLAPLTFPVQPAPLLHRLECMQYCIRHMLASAVHTAAVQVPVQALLELGQRMVLIGSQIETGMSTQAELPSPATGSKIGASAAAMLQLQVCPRVFLFRKNMFLILCVSTWETRFTL